MSRHAYLTDAKTFVRQFDGERWVNILPEFRDKCLADIAAHNPRIVLIWRIRYAEFYLDESGLTQRAADVCPVCDGAKTVLSNFGGFEDCVECGGTGKRR